MPDYTDITKYGTRGLRGTRASVAGDIEIDPTIEAIREEARRSYHNKSYVDSAHDPGAVSNIGLELEQSGYGKSSYDKGIPYSQLENIDDWRGQEQSGIAQLGAGILKGITTAGTTFLDGTVGLLFGIGQAFAERDLSMLFNNDLSKAFREFNQSMEEVLPNYRTKDEIENPWAAKNLFSMNTFADDFLKNIGFTVGAFYSGNAYLSALKALGAGAMSTTAAKTIGSIISGFNEGRIEAGNLYDEQIKAEQPNIDAAKQQIKNEILSSPEYAKLGNQLTSEYESKRAAIEAQPDTFVAGVDGRMTSTKQAALQQLYNEYSVKLKQLENNAMSEVNRRTKALEDNVKQRAEQAALADLALNAIYLPFTDAYAYGKLYGRKFTGKNELAKNVGKETTKAIDKAAEQQVAEETLGRRILKKGKEYVVNPISAKKAALKGFKIGLSEGAEEMNQAWFSSFASNKFQPDSPDAYYNALTNDDYEIQTKDMMTSITEGFMDSWGNSDTYKEGLVGFLTGLIGMPTFGRVNNSDSNTYLGKGKMIGLSGGIFGEIRNSNRLNREASAAVETMNKLVDKVTDAESFFIRAKSFTDATDGYSETDNKFEFNSAADNELFHAIDAFARTGRLQDLRDIIDVDIDNATQEQLEDIARNFSNDKNQFKNADGSDMASTEEGQKKMKEIINQRKQEISDGIDSYTEALEAARRIGNNSLSADQVAELAWLKWKMDKFEDRFNSVKDKDLEKLGDLQNAIAAFKRGRGKGMIDEESEAGQNILKSIDNVEFFIDLLRSAKTPLQFGTLVKNSGNTRDWLKYLGYPMFEDMVGFNAEEFDDLMNDLNDVVKIAEASDEFNKRYKEFKADPTKLIKNREKINKKKNAEKAVKDKSDFKTALEDMSVSEIAEKIRNQEITKDQIDSIEESERKAPVEPDVDPTVAQKIELAEQVNDARQRSIDALEERMQAEGGSQAIEDAIKQVEEAAANAQSPEDFFDLSQAAFVDAQLLAPDEPDVLTPEQEAALDEELQNRRDAATALNQEILDKVKKDREVAASMPAAQPTDNTEQDTTGHDETTKAGSVTQKEEKKEEKKQEPKVDYTREAAQLLQGAGIVAPTKSQVNMLATLLESLTKLTALNNNPLQSIASCRNQMAYRVLGREIDGNFNPDGLGQNNALSPLIDNMLLAYANQPTVTAQPQVEGTTTDTDVPTANPTRTQIEGQEAQEAKRTFTPFPSGPMNFWKPATTEYPIHDNDRHNITYAKQLLNETVDKLIRLLPVADKDVAALKTHLLDVVKELLTKPLAEVQSSNGYRLAQLLIDANKLDNALQMLLDNKVAGVNLQRVRRTVAVTEFLQDKKAYDRLDSGQVQRKHNLSFVTYRELNEAAGETVILVVDDDLGDGVIIGDLMSKNEPVASNQIGLLPFIELCEKELEKHQGEDIIKLPGKSTVSQIMVGRVPYINETNRPTLNTVFGGQPFRIGVAMTGGKNATIKSDSSPLSSGQSDEDTSIWQPLNAIKGQPYILLPTGNADKKYVCVPFLMHVYNENTADSKLGKAIADNVSRIADAMTDKNAVSVKNALLELLSLKDIHINYNGDRVKVTMTRHGETRQTTIYDGLASGDVMTNAILRSLRGTPFRINRKYINGDYNGMDYNSMIGELATCNLVQGTSSTINTWFTMGIVSVGTNGETSTSKPDRIKTTGTNPNARETKSSDGSTSGMIAIGSSLVDPNTFEVYESDGKTPFKGDNNAIITRKARAYGIKNGLPMDEPYDTEWGRYDPIRNKIIPAEPPKVQPIEKSNVDATLLNEVTYIVANMGEFTESELASALGLTGQFAATDIINELVSNGTIHQTGPFHYSWVGPKTNTSKETSEQLVVSGEEVPQGDILESGDTLNADAKAKGYLRTERRKNVWEALTLAQKNALLAMGKLKGEQTMKTLENPAYFDNNKREFKKDITSLLGGFKLRKTTSNKKVWNEQQERRWLAKVLPNLNQAERLRIVDAVIKVGNEKSPITAWGMFQNGIMTIWNRAAKGTLYHEAFHAVTDLLLTDDERKAMFDSAKQLYGNLGITELEEKLAEDFRRYVQREEKPIIGRLIRLFRTLKHILQNLRGKEPYLNTLFYKINRGEFANREPKVIKSTIKLSKNTAEEEEILRNAPRDSEGRLLAPNGKPSNLTERQYVQVRTKAFKNWFGDWENDPDNASKVVDENGEPMVVYHGTLSEFNVFDFNRLGETTGQGYYVDHITGEQIPIDSSYAFFFTDNKIAARSYKNLAIWQQNEFRMLVYRNLQAMFQNNKYSSLNFTKFEGKQKQAQADFIDNVVSPYLGFNVRKEANAIINGNGNLTESQRKAYAERFKQIAEKIRNLPNAQSITNQANNLTNNKEDLQFLIDHKNDLISGKPINRLKNYMLHITSGRGSRERGEVYLSVSQNDGKYYVVGLPNTEGRVLITRNNIDAIIDEYKKGIAQNEAALVKEEKEGKYDTKGNILAVFLNIRNPLEHDYNRSAFTDSYLISAKEGDLEGSHYGDDKLKKPLKIDGNIVPTGYVAARQIRKARQQGNDGVVYKNIRDPFDMTSYGIFGSNQVKSATDNIGTFDPNNPDIRYRLNDSKEETLRREMQRFLDNFGITLEEVDENYDGDLFDDLNRIIYYNSIEDITDGVGKAVAFMMQKQKVMTDLISLYNNFGNNTKGLKRGLKNVAKAIEKAETKEDKQKADFRLPGQKKDENIADALEAIGKDISKELRKLYGFGEEKPSFLNKVWDVIVEFFRMLTPQTRMMFDVIKHQSQHIANSIKINDKSLIIKGMIKPKTDTTATRVDVAQALRDNPYEEGIIAHLSTKGIALAGSASIALNGTLYRPKENPLHDIDFQASQYNKESLDKIVEELSPYWMHTNTIEKEGEGSTETYMILDRSFVSEPYRIPKKNKEGETKGYTKVAVIRDKNTREILGYRINSDLILKDGVKGKMLDFFTGTENNPYGYHSMTINGKNYLISDPRNALAAKVKWLRLKDLWDYNRYIPDDRLINTNEQSDKEVAERVKNAKIIWGHPAIGKTTYIEKHKNEILEWDEEVNPKRDVFINEQVDPNGTLSDEERRQRKREYMRDWKDHPEYIAFLTREWEALKDRAKKENKQIFASPTPLLNLFMDDFDLFLNLTEHEFLQRNQAREAGGYYSSLGWKQAINNALVRVNPDRLVTTDKYFSQIMGDDDMTPNEADGKTPTLNAELIHNTLNDIRSFYNNELAYGNLTQEQLDYLKEREITREQYNSMTMLEKETLFECMFG